MADDFPIIAISPETPFAGEHRWIERLLRQGIATRVHVRHPHITAQSMKALLAGIPRDLWGKISLHDHYELALPGMGVHLNSRHNAVPPEHSGSVSMSVHMDTVNAVAEGMDYVTLSPVYDSISKPGYKACEGLPDLVEKIKVPVYALGGVTMERLPELKARGFAGAAMCGCVAPVFPDIQFITNSDSVDGTVKQALRALRAGIRWVQVRMKKARQQEVKMALERITEANLKYQAVIIVDDHVELAAAPGVDGVHLGCNDMPPAQAREILGDYKIIGRTVNNMDMARMAVTEPVDYYGVGPWRHTLTKANLAPVLGAEGIKEITGYLKQCDPLRGVVAIGGIRPEEIREVKNTGADGAAMSGGLLHKLNDL